MSRSATPPCQRWVTRSTECGPRESNWKVQPITVLVWRYLYDPDGNGVELYWDRPRGLWPHDAEGHLAMYRRPLDFSLLDETE
jgi:hypothetical protein